MDVITSRRERACGPVVHMLRREVQLRHAGYRLASRPPVRIRYRALMKRLHCRFESATADALFAVGLRMV